MFIEARRMMTTLRQEGNVNRETSFLNIALLTEGGPSTAPRGYKHCSSRGRAIPPTGVGGIMQRRRAGVFCRQGIKHPPTALAGFKTAG